MSRKALEQFQITHLDPETTTTLPSNLALRLAARSEYQTTTERRLDSEELLFYNTLLKDKGKEAADAWLNERWHT